MRGANQRDLSSVPGKWPIGQEPMLRPECRLDPGAPDVDEIHARDRGTGLPDVSPENDSTSKLEYDGGFDGPTKGAGR